MATSVIEEYVAAKRRLEENTLTTKEVAERFGVTRHAVYKWVQSGSLKAYDGPPEVGQVFDPVDVEAFTPAPRGYRSHRKHQSD